MAYRRQGSQEEEHTGLGKNSHHSAKKLGAMAWADNLFCIATSVSRAITCMETIVAYLERTWGLFIKPTSKELLVPPGHEECALPPN
jgi:hypothetical protein